MTEKPKDQPKVQTLPPIIYTEYDDNFKLDTFTTGANQVFELTKFLDALLAKCQAQGKILCVNVSPVPQEMFINAPTEGEKEETNV